MSSKKKAIQILEETVLLWSDCYEDCQCNEILNGIKAALSEIKKINEFESMSREEREAKQAGEDSFNATIGNSGGFGI